MGAIYGYIRVSTREQNEDRQLLALREMDVSERNIFLDKQPAKTSTVRRTGGCFGN